MGILRPKGGVCGNGKKEVGLEWAYKLSLAYRVDPVEPVEVAAPTTTEPTLAIEAK